MCTYYRNGLKERAYSHISQYYLFDKFSVSLWYAKDVLYLKKKKNNTRVSGSAHIQEGFILFAMQKWSSVSKWSLSLSCWLSKSIINTATNPTCHLANPEMSNHIYCFGWGLKLQSRGALRPLSEALIMTTLTKKTLGISQMRKSCAFPQSFCLVNSLLTAKCSTCLEKTCLRGKDYFLSLIKASYLHISPSHNIC